MCLYTKKNCKTKKELYQSKQIADRDIRVYKVLSSNNTTPYMRFKYEKGYQYSAKISKRIHYSYIFNSYHYRIDKGLHACTNYKAALKIKQIDIYDGKIVVMYIPKGSEYYKGNKGDIVSNHFVWY